MHPANSRPRGFNGLSCFAGRVFHASFPAHSTPVETRFRQMSEEDALRRKLDELRTEHRDLDDVIDRLAGQAHYDQLKLQRLKKRKLMLKDLIAKVESQLLPDIIA